MKKYGTYLSQGECHADMLTGGQATKRPVIALIAIMIALFAGCIAAFLVATAKSTSDDVNMTLIMLAVLPAVAIFAIGAHLMKNRNFQQ